MDFRYRRDESSQQLGSQVNPQAINPQGVNSQEFNPQGQGQSFVASSNPPPDPSVTQQSQQFTQAFSPPQQQQGWQYGNPYPSFESQYQGFNYPTSLYSALSYGGGTPSYQFGYPNMQNYAMNPPYNQNTPYSAFTQQQPAATQAGGMGGAQVYPETGNEPQKKSDSENSQFDNIMILTFQRKRNDGKPTSSLADILRALSGTQPGPYGSYSGYPDYDG
ncbi:unnamed protein product [Nippostrongylus brasiliensis]|uniref:DUF1421 domain-containing protein n=1 Tax=Nippostrongylus brasiliensis TaxID=27835 RepID=A0A0N4Y6M1_NIPBR|nr:unnamed protein product [Nippostrongylus brasiliensis]